MAFDREQIEIATAPALSSVRGHVHPGWHLVAVFSGELKEDAGGTVHTMRRGSCRLSPPGSKHDIDIGQDELKCVVASIDKSWVESLGIERRHHFFDRIDVWAPLMDALTEQVPLLGRLQRELGIRKSLASIAAHRNGCDPIAPPNWLVDALEYLSYAPQTYPIERLAERGRVSRAYFSRMFKKHFGISPVEYRTISRAKLAIGLLQDKDASLTEIAYECGFSDQSHLSKTLVAKLGITPGAIRSQIRCTFQK